jgi:hypothetical protein
MKRITVVLAALLLLCRAAAAKEDFSLWHGASRLSFETITLANDEHLGLAGIHYLVDVSPRWYAGIGLYGAVTGDRGGFFTGGFMAGAKLPLAGPLSVDCGLFLGGGGGRSAFQGGGLMVRPHLGLHYALEDVHLGLEYALVSFPNGDIRSRHAALVVDIPFDALRVTSEHPENLAAILNLASRTANREIVFDREYFAARYQVYSPADKVMDVGGASRTGTIQAVGFEYGRALGDVTYLFVETSGAAGGFADGYAEVLFGGGARVPLFAHTLLLDGRISGGAAGGGRVDTGGGALAKASLGLKLAAGDGLSIDARAGYVESAGTFHGRTVEIGLSYGFEAAAFGPSGMTSALAADDLDVKTWTTRLVCQQYTSLDASMRNGRGGSTISLLGTKIDLFLDRGAFYLTGQAHTAFAGDAGGYAIGLMGLGYLSGPVAGTGVHVFAEALGGAAGGGGIDVGGGAAVQSSVGLLYDVSSNTGIEASVGRIKATRGELDSIAVGLSVVYRFSTAGSKTGWSSGEREYK